MAYTIRKHPSGEIVDSGFTRAHVVRALVAHGLLRTDEKCPSMPRYGFSSLIARPLSDPRGSVVIYHV